MHRRANSRLEDLERKRQAQLQGPVDAVISAFVQCYPDEVRALSSAIKTNLAYGAQAQFTDEEVEAGAHLNDILHCLRHGLPLPKPLAHPLWDGGVPEGCGGYCRDCGEFCDFRIEE